MFVLALTSDTFFKNIHLRGLSFLSGSLYIITQMYCQTENRVIFGMACQISTDGYKILCLHQYLWEMSILDSDSDTKE